MEKKDNSIGAVWLSKYKTDDGRDKWTGKINGEKITMYQNEDADQENKKPNFKFYKRKNKEEVEQTVGIVTPEEVGKARKTELETVNEEANEILASDLPF